MTLVDVSTGWILGWTLLHSIWQGALVAVSLALLFRVVPGSMVRLRSAIAWGALLLLFALAAGTWTLVDTEWREHAACWDSEAYAARIASVCANHAVPAARAALEDGTERAEGPLAWTERMALPVPAFFRSISLGATSGVLLIVVLAGALALAGGLRLLVGLRSLGGVLRRARAPDREELPGLMRHLGDQLCVTCPVELRESAEISTPAVAGWRPPIILVPEGMAEALDSDQWSHVLAHELVHVRNRHYLANLVQRALDCMCVFNPFALWISECIREEREALCDRIAAGPQSGRRLDYAETLLQIERLRRPAGPALIGVLGEGSLLRRIRRLVDSPTARGGHGLSRDVLVGAGALTTLVVVAVLSMTMVSLTSWAVMSYDIEVRRTADAETEARPSGSSVDSLGTD